MGITFDELQNCARKYRKLHIICDTFNDYFDIFLELSIQQIYSNPLSFFLMIDRVN